MNKLKPKKLLIFGNYGVPNFGDEAILTGLLKGISRSKWDICVVSADPAYTSKLHNIKSIYPLPFGFRSLFRGNLFKTLKAIRNADLILFGGGGLFQDVERRAFYMWAFFLRVCLFFNKKVAVVANSIGPLNKKSSINSAKRIFKKVHYFSVRDLDSQELLIKLGVPSMKISLATDAVFFLSRINTKKKRQGIVLSLHGEHTSRAQIEVFKNFVQSQKKSKKKVSFLSMQSKITGDNKLAKKIGVSLYKINSVNDAMNAVASSQIVITSRLHIVIFAILSGTPFIALSKMPKVENFLESVGLNKYFVQEVSDKKLQNLMDKILKNPVKVSTEIKNTYEQEKAKTKLIFPDFV